MREETTSFMALMCQLPGNKPVGRSRRRWVDNVKRDVRGLGLEKTWTERATDMIEWKEVIVAALAYPMASELVS